MFNRSFFTNLPPVTKNILIINVIIWLFTALVPASNTHKLLDCCALHYLTSPGFHFWQLFTYMFIQVEFLHLFFNMWALLMFGYAIEKVLGSKRFLFFYISCGLGAAIVQMGVFALTIEHYAANIPPQAYSEVITNGWDIIQQGMNYSQYDMGMINQLINGSTIGASGAIFGILLAVGMLFPDNRMYIMFIPYPVKAKWVVLGYGLLELTLGFASPSDGVAHFAHLGGMIFGFIMLYYWKQQMKRHGQF